MIGIRGESIERPLLHQPRWTTQCYRGVNSVAELTSTFDGHNPILAALCEIRSLTDRL